MKIAALALLWSVLSAGRAESQILTPVHWSYGAKKLSSTEAVVFFKATIDAGWHVYSQFVKPGGPVKTSFDFDASSDFTLDGSTQEPTPTVRKEKVFGNMEIGFFEQSVIFKQKIRLKAAQANVKGKLQYMTCNDSQCLPPDEVDFSIAIK
jgi:hypothetical protein